MVWGLVLLVNCGAPFGIIRGYAAHPIGVAVALLWRCLALGARLDLGVRTNTPDDANKKPQLMVWGLVLLVNCGAPFGIIRGYAAHPHWGRRRFALAISRARRSARTRGSNLFSR
jgi:hypothetical protein